MARQKEDISAISRKLIEDAQAGIFKPVYVLMGDEPYYPDLVCQAIIDNCVDEFGKDFNETVCYGADVTAEQVVTAARRFPMMSDRQLVVVKEAQMLKGIEDIAIYCNEPLDSTVLVLLLHKASLDKRKALYKSVQKIGVVLDSPALRDYEVPGWIGKYYSEKSLSIDPAAANLLAESVGTELSIIVLETDKLLKNLPEGVRSVSVADIEKNVGISRQFSIFELTKELSFRNAPRALTIATHLGNAARFNMPQAVSALFMHFNRILKYGALLARNPYPSAEDKSAALAGVNPYFFREYDTAVKNYPVPSAMNVISLLCQYDYLGKGGDGGATPDSALLVELVAKILNA
ncbi:MAG: DNA polymerase III subunit delta [Bacteroidales bacterium]|nr:DNA polymerase III subunit delta [Bacteroidales bacterium]